jgi:hypothetical protein
MTRLRPDLRIVDPGSSRLGNSFIVLSRAGRTLLSLTRRNRFGEFRRLTEHD